MEELAICSIVPLIDQHAIFEVLFIVNYIFEAVLAHISFEAIFNILFCVALEVHEDRIVEVNHRSLHTRLIIYLLEAFNGLSGLLILHLVFDTLKSDGYHNFFHILTAIDDFTASCLNNNLPREPAACLLIFNHDLMLARFNIACKHVHIRL